MYVIECCNFGYRELKYTNVKRQARSIAWRFAAKYGTAPKWCNPSCWPDSELGEVVGGYDTRIGNGEYSGHVCAVVHKVD